MHQPVFTGKNGYEGSEVNNSCDGASIDLSNLGLCRDSHNHLDSGVSGGGILTKHFHCAVVVDVDGRTRFLRYLANGRATLADNVAYLILINF